MSRKPLYPFLLCHVFFLLLALPCLAAGEGASVSGRLLRLDDTPVAGVEVKLLKAMPMRLGKGAPPPAGVTRTGTDGSFAFTGIAPGAYAVNCTRSFDRHRTPITVPYPYSVMLSKGDRVDIGVMRYVLSDIRCRGRITLDGQDCPKGMRVYWRKDDGIFMGPAFTCADGYFTLCLHTWSELLGMDQRIVVVSGLGHTFEHTVRLVSGGYVEIPLQMSFASVNGKVVDHEGKPLAGLTVIAVPAQSRDLLPYVSPSLTRKDGSFYLVLHPGEWRVYAYRSPVEWVKIDVKIADDKEKDLTIAFPSVQRSTVKMALRLTVEGFPFKRFHSRYYEMGKMPKEAARMLKVFLFLMPVGQTPGTTPLPPFACCWEYDEDFIVNLQDVPQGQYHAYLCMGCKLPTNYRELRVAKEVYEPLKQAQESFAFSGVVGVSHVGWGPYPNGCSAFTPLTPKIPITVSPEATNPTIEKDIPWTATVPNSFGFTPSLIRSVYESIIQNLKEEKK
jgi:hypothetical protein